MAGREILTIQLGQYSNFIGTHWWNLQETNFGYDPENPSEINHDVLYREGETRKKQTTFTPRLLLVDLKGSLGYLSKRGNLYETEHSTANVEPLWPNVEIKTDPEEPTPSFIENLEKITEDSKELQNFEFDTDPTKWVDYLVPRLHPRTINIIEEYKHESSDEPFNIFHSGQEVWKNNKFDEDFEEKIRLYVEECDFLQGFHVLVDSADGFSGLGAACVGHLRDEYGKSILTFPVLNSKTMDPSASDLIRAVNIALCWEHVGEHSSLFSPLCCGENGWRQPEKTRKFKHLTFDQDSNYQSSALLATALDTLTLRYRHKKYTMASLSDLCADLNKLGRKAVATSISLPFPMTSKRDLIDVLDDFEGDLWTSLTPNCQISKDKSMQSIALRGVMEERLKRPLQEAKKQILKAAYKCSTVHEMMSLYLSCSQYASATYLSTVEQGLKIKMPYPKIFNNDVHSNGDIAEWPVGEEVESVPVMAGLHSTPSLSTMFESLHHQVSRVKNIRRLNAFNNSGLEQDEFVETVDRLLDYKEAYEDHYV